jgi:hypothetical protein
MRIGDFLDRMGRETGPALAGQPEAEIEVRTMLGQAYTVAFAYQKYVGAAEHFGRAYELSRSLPGGEESERTLRLAAEYALPLSRLSTRAAEARRIASWAHQTAARKLGEAHPITHRAAHAYGLALEPRQAERVMRPVFEQVMAQPPQTIPVEAYGLAADLALLVRQDLRDPSLSESLAKRAIDRMSAYPRPAEVAIYRSRLMRQIAAARAEQGDSAGAVQWATEAWTHGQREMGRFHPETLMRLCNLGEALVVAGRRDEARAKVQREVESARGVLHADDTNLNLLHSFLERTGP